MRFNVNLFLVLFVIIFRRTTHQFRDTCRGIEGGKSGRMSR